jgi:hypothetical protein
MSRRFWVFMLFVLVVAGVALDERAVGAASGKSETAIPRALQDWQAWVLKDQEFLRCPFLAGMEVSSQNSHRCAWPERPQLTVDSHGGRFAQRWEVYNDSWVALPGDLDHWPQSVQLDGKPAPLVARGDIPLCA